MNAAKTLHAAQRLKAGVELDLPALELNFPTLG